MARPTTTQSALLPKINPTGGFAQIGAYATPPPAWTPAPPLWTPIVSPAIPAQPMTPSTTSSGWSSNDLDTFIRQYQDAHPVASRDAFLDLANQVQAKFGIGRYDYGANGGLSNNELAYNGPYKVMGAEDSATPYWYRPGMDDGGGAGGGGDLSALLGAFGSSFDDPDTANLLDFIRGRVGTLMAPIDDPNYDRYVASAQDLVTRLQTPWTNPNSATAQATLEQILKDVTGAPFTDDQSMALRAEAFDELTKSRDADARNTLARMAALGHGKGSGTIAEALRDVERTYQTNRATNERALTIAGIQQANQNRQTAAQVSEALHDLALSDQQYNESRGGQAVTLLQAITQAAAGRRAEQEARAATATSLMGIPVQLGDQRLDQALRVLGVASGSSADATSILGTLASIASAAQANSNTAAANNAEMWSRLIQSIPELFA